MILLEKNRELWAAQLVVSGIYKGLAFTSSTVQTWPGCAHLWFQLSVGKGRRSRCSSELLLHNEFGASLGYMSLCFQKNKKK